MSLCSPALLTSLSLSCALGGFGLFHRMWAHHTRAVVTHLQQSDLRTCNPGSITHLATLLTDYHASHHQNICVASMQPAQQPGLGLCPHLLPAYLPDQPAHSPWVCTSAALMWPGLRVRRTLVMLGPYPPPPGSRARHQRPSSSRAVQHAPFQQQRHRVRWQMRPLLHGLHPCHLGTVGTVGALAQGLVRLRPRGCAPTKQASRWCGWAERAQPAGSLAAPAPQAP